MSIESAKAYIDRILIDEEFKNRVNEAVTAEARNVVVKSEGFDFTKEEIESVVTRYQEHDRDVCRRVVLQRYGKLRFNDSDVGWIII